MGLWYEVFSYHFPCGTFLLLKEENELLHDIFGFTPKRKNLTGSEHHLSSVDKRMFRSPNSVVSKARTQFLNKQRILWVGTRATLLSMGMKRCRVNLSHLNLMLESLDNIVGFCCNFLFS